MVEEDKNDSKNKNRKSCERKKNNNEKKLELPEEPAACTGQQQPPKKKNRKEVAIFGNYKNYYGYRVGQDLEEDPRLKVMKREWFQGKDCLDIGCNSGIMTIAVARKFGCQSILGVDIDGARIEDAHWTLRKVMHARMRSVASKIAKSVGSESATGSESNAAESLTQEKRDNDGNSVPAEKDLFKIVSFQKGNFVQSWRPPGNTYYHTILCLSVTKWVHLNWGDHGLIMLFRRAWTLLHPGGVFILEPQPWSSYYNNRLVSETASANYKEIQIPPEDFQDVLLDKIGFRMVENLTSGLSGTKLGFDRPILAFWK